MDIFKFNTVTSPTKLEGGEIVNGLKSKMWIERYDEAGEFEFVASANSGVKDILPIGTIVSHVDTTEVMIVENHEINDSKGVDTEIKITGRGFETLFENRIVGSNRIFPTNNGPQEYVTPADKTWAQAVLMIEDHILTSKLVDDSNALLYTSVIHTATGDGESVERLFKRKDLYSSLLDLLSVDELGIKIVRPGAWSPLGTTSQHIAIIIHRGEDKTAEIVFSYDNGEIESADYLWSIKKSKNAALVSGKWVETFVSTDASDYDKRIMFVDASDIDEGYDVAPTGVILDYVVASMQIRGNQALSAQKEIAITKAEISEKVNHLSYRKDFDVGDFITIRGNYNESTRMRVSEYVEIEDSEGKKGYPTLSMETKDTEFSLFGTKQLYISRIVADEPVGYWTLNETNGDVVHDYSGNRYDGVYMGTPIVGVPNLAHDGYAVQFKQPSKDYIYIIHDVLPQTGPFTLEAWIKPTTVPAYSDGSPAIVTHREDNGSVHAVLGFNDYNSGSKDGRAFIGFYDGYWTQLFDPNPVVAGQTYHYAGTFDGANLILYRNGVQVASGNYSRNASGGNGRIYIGRNGADEGYFNGVIDEVAVYTRALPANRILAHYETTS